MSQPVPPLIKLNNGLSMPQLGLGVWQTKDGPEVELAVSTAIETGYRLFDTAAVYGNETGVGNAIRASRVRREELFITTKLWNSDQGYDRTLKAFDASLKKLQLDYIDLYLIHWPVPARGLFTETWRAFEELYAQGRVKAIGVSNFKTHHLDELLAMATIKPAVNQVELHPYFPQTELRDYARRHNIAIESWSPIGGGRSELLEEPLLSKIGQSYNKSPAQVVIRWHLQSGLIVIPKSTHSDRIRENYQVFDFELTQVEMTDIDSLRTDVRVGFDPDSANFH
ncbi:MAG: aldo/keto reductase [Candidatus Saccharibacteria bacterium]